MGFWGDVKDAASSLGDQAGDTWSGVFNKKNVTGTWDAVAKAATAPVGLVWDLASTPFDGKDDSLGSVLGKFLDRGGDVLEPAIGADTIAGSMLRQVGTGMAWAYEEGVDQPLASIQLVQADLGYNLSTGKGIMPSVRELVDPGKWAEAYKQADDMSAGQAFTVAQYQAGMLANAAVRGETLPEGLQVDPMEGDPYAAVHHRADASGIPGMGPLMSTGRWTYDITAMVGADPTAGALKGVGMVRNVRVLHNLSVPERANLGNLLESGEDLRQGFRIPRPSAKSRAESFFRFLDGANKLKRPLLAAEIRHVPEIRQYSSEPTKISSLLGDAAKIEDKGERWDMYRRVLGVAAGDPNAVQRFADERVLNPGPLMDQINNVSKGTPINIEELVQNPDARYAPRFIHALQQQVDNLDSDKAVTKFVDHWNAQIDGTLETAGSMTHLPGPHLKANRAINREHDTGLGRIGHKVGGALDERAAAFRAKQDAVSTVYQRGLYSVPLLVIRGAKALNSVYLNAPVAASDALRTTQFTGQAAIHDWGAASTQLDSMMKIARVPNETRIKTLTEAMGAGTEAERLSAIARVESLSMKSIASHYSAKYGESVDEEFIERMMLDYTGQRQLGSNSIKARAYAATESEGELAASQLARRERAAEGIEDAAEREAFLRRPWTPRVDQFVDELGAPVALPMLETQLPNYVPLFDVHLAEKLMKREFSSMARRSRAWKAQVEELRKLDEIKGAARLGHMTKSQSDKIDAVLERRRVMADSVLHYAQKANRGWKFSVLMRLGYPIRVVGEENLRIVSRIGAANAYLGNTAEAGANLRYNAFGRRQEAQRAWDDARRQRTALREELESSEMLAYPERAAQAEKLARKLRGHRARGSYLSGLREAGEDVTERASVNDRKLADATREYEYLLNKMGDRSPEVIQSQLDDLEAVIQAGAKKLRQEKRRTGSRKVVVDGMEFPGALDDTYRALSSSKGTFDYQVRGVEEETYKGISTGDWRTVAPDEPGHLAIWEDVLRHQVGTSPVAKFFLKGGTADEFVDWIKQPEQALLRKRVPHYAADPEDWGQRVEQLVLDYAPTTELRQAVLDGKVTRRMLGKFRTEERPAVHGELFAHNAGDDRVARAFGEAMNGIYRRLGEIPTDRLSRHPFFAAMYEMHVKEHYAVLKAARGPGAKYSEADREAITRMARRDALHDVRTTLFDISAHSHAAHVMRFISPFFAAHQESLQRWWKIAADNPAVVRRYQQAFDVPRYAGVTVDENGDPVKPGAPVSSKHRVLLPDGLIPGDQQWSVNENSFNLLLPGGLANPGAGPLVTIPGDYLARRYADEPAIARVAEMLNPYPQESVAASAFPATLRRILAFSYGQGGPDLLGVGQAEFNASFTRSAIDAEVEFKLKNGRLPNESEKARILEDSRHQALTTSALRILWNAGTPFPPKPESRYAAIQAGWWKIKEAADAKGYDFEWAQDQFKKKYGDAYLPLMYSAGKNPAGVDGTPLEVKAVKRYRSLLQGVDPSLNRMVTGPYMDAVLKGMSDEEAARFTERTGASAQWFRSEKLDGIDGETYFDKRDPIAAMEQRYARQGWDKFDELNTGLTEAAVQLGLKSYLESDELKAARKAGIEQIKQENAAWARDYESRDSGKFNDIYADIRKVASSTKFNDDVGRSDIQTLRDYISVRDYFTDLFAWRSRNGMTGPDSEEGKALRGVFTTVVGALVESNSYFSKYAYDGVIEFDPMLID